MVNSWVVDDFVISAQIEDLLLLSYIVETIQL